MRTFFVALLTLFSVSAVSGQESFTAIDPQATRIVTCPIFDASAPLDVKVSSGDVLFFSYTAPTANPPVEILVKAEYAGKSRVLFKDTLDLSTTIHWKRAQVPLKRLAGKQVRITFGAVNERKPSEDLAGTVIWGGVRVGSFRRRPSEKNLILISIDTLRADHLSGSGYWRKTSPHLDQLANEGTYFKQAVSQAPWTLPSHMSVFSGLYPSGHQMQSRIRQPQGKRRVSRSIKLLTEVMRDQGYVTQAFTGSGYVSAAFGFDRGFDEFSESRLVVDGQRGHVFTDGGEWLKKHAAEKFFLFLHSYDVHGPYIHDHFVGDEGGRLSARYDSGIYFVDEHIKALMDQLKSLGLLDDTLIVIFSDHGEELNQRGSRHAHGHTLYDELILVPLFFRLPGVVTARAIGDFTPELIDIYPTVLDLLGFPPPPGLAGKSLKPILTGGSPPSTSFGVTEVGFFPDPGDLKRAGPRGTDLFMRSLRTTGDTRKKLIYCPAFETGMDDYNLDSSRLGAWSLNYAAGGKQLFDLSTDPAELKDISAQEPRVVKDMLKTLKERAKPSSEEFAPENPAEVDETVTDELKNSLESLGY